MGVARNPRFRQGLDRSAASFTASVFFDWRLLPYDIEGSIAHITMLAKQGIVSDEDRDQIVQGLKKVLVEWESGELEPRIDWEDVHMNVEGRLLELIGPVAGKLHTARSRNDQVALDMHLYLKSVGLDMAAKLRQLIRVFLRRAEELQSVVIPGYTHMQAAQPVLFGHHLLAYVEMFRRDYSRLKDWQKRADVSPLGAGALSGTPYATKPEETARLLGFSAVARNSLDAVSDRDFLLEFLSWAALNMVHLSRLGEELVLWSSVEFGYVTMDDRYSTGSSIMPQKKNPDVAELVRGKSGRVFGNLMALLTVMKGLPLAYDSDMQEDKEAVFDTIDTLSAVLDVASGMVDTMRVNRERIAARLGHDFTAATDLADMLVGEGLPFRQAHHIVGGLVGRLETDGLGFSDVTPEYLKKVAPEVRFEWMSQLAPEQIVSRRTQSFGTAPSSVARALAEQKEWLQSEDQQFQHG